MTIKTQLHGYTLALFIGTLLTACGGGDEPRVTFFKELPQGGAFLPIPGSSATLQAQFQADQIPFENPRCSGWTLDPRPEKQTGFVGGAPPVYFLVDVPESSASLFQQKYRFRVFDPAEHLSVALPSYDCKLKGY